MRVVAALGGNAFVHKGTPLSVEGERLFARAALGCLAPFFEPGVQLLVSHGNGPQVGHQLDRAERCQACTYALPLDVCVAQTQGELGYLLAQALSETLATNGRTRPVVSLVTQVEVDPADPAFGRPVKPVGPFLDEAQARALRDRGAAVVEDAGRGWRRVVPSPSPVRVLELEVVRQLLLAGVAVVAGGGGGVPVVRLPAPAGMQGVEAVIDKDLTSALLADDLDADLLAILTDVPEAYTDFRTPRQAPVGRIAVSQARTLLAGGHFAPGSMGPKIDACVRFVRRTGRRALICDPPSLAAALRGEAGTLVVPDDRR